MMDAPEEPEIKPSCLWRVEEADEAKYNFSDQKGLWQPKPEDILSVFEQLAKGGALPLKWTCPGRRAPESDAPNEDENEMETEMETDLLKEDNRDPEPSAFDFDDSGPDTNVKVTPWRTHAAGMARTPKTEKRVARMDNIMDSLFKQQVQRAAEREARKTKGGTPSHAQQGRGRLIKFGSPTPKKGSGASASSPLAFTSTFSPSEPTSAATESAASPNAASASTTLDDVTESTSAQILPGTASLLMPSEEQEIKDSSEMERKPDVQVKLEQDNEPKSNDTVSINTDATSSSTAMSSHSSFVTISSASRNKLNLEATSGGTPGLSLQTLDQNPATSAALSSLADTNSVSISNSMSSNLITTAPSSTATSSPFTSTTETPENAAKVSLPNTNTASPPNNPAGPPQTEELLPASSLSTTNTATAKGTESNVQAIMSSSSSTTTNPPSESSSHSGDTPNQPATTSLPHTSSVSSPASSTTVSTTVTSSVSPMETE